MNALVAHRSVRVAMAMAIALLCAMRELCAQRTWIVDSANGAGTDFSDLYLAIAAASPGDTVILRPGLSPSGVPYQIRGDINFGLRIVAPGNVRPWVRAGGYIRVPAGQLFVLDNVRFGPGPYWGMAVQSSLGTVVLSRLFMEGLGDSGIGGAEASTRVIWTDCNITAHSTGVIAAIQSSRIYVLDCRIEALYTGDRRYLPIPYAAITVQDHSTAWIVNTYAKGGE